MLCVQTTHSPNLIERIPDPEEVRDRLVACTKEAAVLRDLLRVAERAKRDREGLQARRADEPRGHGLKEAQ